MEILPLTIGCDPEGFFRKATGRREFVSAHDIIPGTKESPFPVNKGAIQVDGMAWEYNIVPASSREEFIQNNLTVLEELKRMAGPKYEVVIKPTCQFGDKVWKTTPRQNLQLGCEPDYNAYTFKVNPRPNETVKFRTASGHIHIGWTKDVDPMHPQHFEACTMLAKQLDATIGVMSCLVDSDKRRRELYGKAGAFRPKSYGMEYRTLSNFWVKDYVLMGMVYDVVEEAFKSLMNGAKEYKDTPLGVLSRDASAINSGKYSAYKYYRQAEFKRMEQKFLAHLGSIGKTIRMANLNF